jgi:protein TonB
MNSIRLKDSIRQKGGDRIKGAAGAVLLQALLGYGLYLGLSAQMPARIADEAIIYITPISPPPAIKVVPRRMAARRPAGAAAPPALKGRATEVVVPPPIVPIPVPPPPIVTAPVAGPGADVSAGASNLPGPGTGAGGEGAGTGNGAAGDGDGGGTPSRWIRGRIKDSDYPRAAAEARIGGSLVTRYLVAANGRVTACSIEASSGNALLDETTCRLVMERYRYKPARDAYGRPMPETVIENHRWVVEPVLQQPDPE